MTLEQFYARNSFCKKLRHAWPELTKRLLYLSVPEGEVVVAQGDQISDEPCLFIILDGSVKIFVQDRAGAPHGDGQLVTALQPGSVFGEMGHVMERSATVVTASYCQFVTLTKYGRGETRLLWDELGSIVVRFGGSPPQ